MKDILRHCYAPRADEERARDDDRHINKAHPIAVRDLRRLERQRLRCWKEARDARHGSAHVTAVTFAQHPDDLVIAARRKRDATLNERIEQYVRRCAVTRRWFAQDSEDPRGESEVSRDWVAAWLMRLDLVGLHRLLALGRL